MDERKYDEIERAMGPALGTAKAIILRARIRLRGIVTASTRQNPNEEQYSSGGPNLARSKPYAVIRGKVIEELKGSRRESSKKG